MSCNATECPNESVISWERWMTPAEIDQYHQSGDLPPGENSGKLMVYACDDHKLQPPELMTITHGAQCTAPPDCNCQ